MSDRRRDDILDIIRDNPGITSIGIHQRLTDHSWAARRFGRGSFWTALLGPSTGSMFVEIWRLEEDGLIRAEWGVGTAARGFRRPRHYWVTDEKPHAG